MESKQNVNAAPVQSVVKRYVGDIRKVGFEVSFNPSDTDEPWSVWRDDGLGGSHHTLDQVLYWECWVGDDAIISNELREKINQELSV